MFSRLGDWLGYSEKKENSLTFISCMAAALVRWLQYLNAISSLLSFADCPMDYLKHFAVLFAGMIERNDCL